MRFCLTFFLKCISINCILAKVICQITSLLEDVKDKITCLVLCLLSNDFLLEVSSDIKTLKVYSSLLCRPKIRHIKYLIKSYPVAILPYVVIRLFLPLIFIRFNAKSINTHILLTQYVMNLALRT